MLANRKEPVRRESLNTEEQQILSLGHGFEGVRRRQNPAEDKSTTPSSPAGGALVGALLPP